MKQIWFVLEAFAMAIGTIALFYAAILSIVFCVRKAKPKELSIHRPECMDDLIEEAPEMF